MSELQRLRDRVEELEGELGIPNVLPAPAFARPAVQKILGLLLKRQIISRSTVEVALVCGRDVSFKYTDTHLFHVRKWLREQNIELGVRPGQGWFLTNKQKSLLRKSLPDGFER